MTNTDQIKARLAAAQLPALAVFPEEYTFHTGGKATQYFIGTAAIHPQLKNHYPIVSLAYSMTPDRKPQVTLNLKKEHAELFANAPADIAWLLAEVARLEAKKQLP